MQKKHLFTFLLSVTFSLILFSQDKIYLHNGINVDVKIIKVSEFTISYNYPNETAEETIGKYAVDKIKYSSGGKISDKVVVNSKTTGKVILEKLNRPD
jgi:sRNA-binding regulator protein Hfq